MPDILYRELIPGFLYEIELVSEAVIEFISTMTGDEVNREPQLVDDQTLQHIRSGATADGFVVAEDHSFGELAF